MINLVRRRVNNFIINKIKIHTDTTQPQDIRYILTEEKPLQIEDPQLTILQN